MAKTHKKSTYGFVLGNCSCCGVHYSRCRRRSFIGDPQSATNRTTIINIGSGSGSDSGGAKVPDWEEGQSYDKDQIVIIYEGDNAVVYRSLTNDNDSSPLLTNPWEYVGEVSGIPNWDDGTDYNLGDKVLYLIEVGGESLSVLFESTIDSPSSNPLEGMQTGEWILKAVLADPVGWDVDTEYSPYGDIYPTVVSYGSSYYTTHVSVIGVNPLSTDQWEKVSNLEFDEKNFRIVDGKVYLGEIDEYDNIFLSSTDESSIIKLSKGLGSSSFEKKNIIDYGSNTYHVDNAMTMSGPYETLSLGKSITLSGAYLPMTESKLDLSANHTNGLSRAALTSLNREGGDIVGLSVLELSNTSSTSLINLHVTTAGGNVSGFRIGRHPSHNIFIDQFNEIGLRYDNDYSVNGSQYDRWIPDWGAVKSYVDENGGSIELGSGLHFDNDGKVALGLDVSEPSGTTGVLTKDLYLLRGTPLYGSAISIGESNIGIRVTSELGIQGISVGDDESSPIFITDSKNKIGAVYISDYSTNGKLNDRWIPDWGAVKSQVTWANLTDKPTTFTPSAHTHTIGQVTGLESALNNKINNSEKGAVNGVAELDENGKVLASQLPSFVDDVLEFDSLEDFPEEGESGKIYIAKNTNLSYRWGGTEYVVISPSLALGTTSSTAGRGDWTYTAYQHSQSTGNPHNTQIEDIENLLAILESKQDNLASGTNIKTINGVSILGSGDIVTPNDVYMGSNGINISSSNVISPVYGTAANTIAQGNDSRINNGQTAYEWGDHAGLYLPVTGGTVTGVIKSPAPVADEDLANKAYVDSKASPFNIIDVTQQDYTDKAINVIPFNNTGMSYSEGAIDFGVTRDATHTMGLYAFKQGLETTASGIASSAFGANTTASGDNSSAFGAATTASSWASSAFGYFTEASGYYSSAFGANTTASGQASSAFGSYTEASGNYSTAFGAYSIASGNYSSAFGGATASGIYSSAFGQGTKASGNYSYAFGYHTEASGNFSSAFGLGSIANEYASLSIGYYSTDGAVETSWTTGSPIFKVGNGTSAANRRNAYTLYNDGRSEQIKDVEVTEIGQGFVLKSPDGTRWRITVDNSGNLTATSL